MTESFLGILISAMAVSTLMLSIQTVEKAYRNAGKYSLTNNEFEIIKSANLNSESNLNLLKNDLDNLPQSYWVMKDKNIVNAKKNKKINIDKNGMSLVEAIISITLLSLFFTIYTGFVEIASKFNQKGSTNLENSNGLFIDHHYLALTLDEYKNVLSQPGILKSEINKWI